MQRPRPPTGHLLISHGGAGQVWVDGQWRRCRAGEAYLAPPLAPMGFRTVARRRWQFAWVYLRAPSDEPSPVIGTQASITNVDPRPIVNAIEGLYLEATALARVDRLGLWADLVNEYAREIARASEAIDPLWRLWADVDARLNEHWSLERLAAHATMRPEALRRLTLRTTGRSPMRQVTHLRMRRAEALLRSTGDKLFGIARQVGYQNTFAFSTAFNRWKGASPKACRASARLTYNVGSLPPEAHLGGNHE